jgi:hypothetical protein
MAGTPGILQDMNERTGAPPEITSEADIVAGGVGEVLRALLTE